MNPMPPLERARATLVHEFNHARQQCADNKSNAVKLGLSALSLLLAAYELKQCGSAMAAKSVFRTLTAATLTGGAAFSAHQCYQSGQGRETLVSQYNPLRGLIMP